MIRVPALNPESIRQPGFKSLQGKPALEMQSPARALMKLHS